MSADEALWRDAGICVGGVLLCMRDGIWPPTTVSCVPGMELRLPFRRVYWSGQRAVECEGVRPWVRGVLEVMCVRLRA
eukprot:2315523-Prymnesium_polylepis.1